MNRRVLLIDLDPIFRDQLIHLLGRYRVVVMHEPEVDRALALAAADAPSAIIIGVDEPDKAGFRVFQKCKKGALAKIPVVLVTASVAPEAFAKHRGLKLHADEYLDKRSLTNDELLAKLDNLIGLGDLQEDDDIGIPIEDDIPMEIGDGDVVLDETVDAGGAELAASDSPGEGHRVDSVVEAETDAAFDALLGGDASAELGHARSQPRAASEPAIVHAGPPAETAADAIPEPVPHLGRDDRETVPPPFDEAVPEPVPHPHHVESELEPAPPRYEHSVDSDVLEEEPMSVGEEHDSTVHSLESSAAIPLDDQELVAVDEHSDEPVAPARGSLPRAASEPIITSAARIPSDPGVPVGQQTGNHPAIDLGLEAVASDADREQSGIHDRRALRKIAELDRQILQLKNELDRARATAETAAKGGGREAQFLNLREQVLAKDRELTTAKAEVGARDSELVDVREKLKQLQHAKQALEGKNSELEQRIFEGGDRSKELDGKLREALAQATRLQQELDTQQHALSDSETGRKRLEQELVDERARRAASASEAERALRAEREQLVERHRGDLAAARDEGVQARDAALARLREQLDGAHAQGVEDAVEELRRANAEEHDAALATLERQHTRELVNLKADQAGELRRIEGELRAEITRLGSALAETRTARDAAVAQAAVDKAAALEELAHKHAANLDALEEQHDEDAERNAEAQAAAIAQMKAEVDRTHAMTEAKLASAARDRDALARDHEQRVARLGEEHQGALAELQTQHTDELERLADERAQLADSAKRAADAHRGALAEVQQRLEAELAEAREHSAREASEQRATLQSMKRAADEAASRHQKQLDAAIDAHARVLAEAEAKHERALAMANGEVLKVRAATEAEHANTLAARDTEHEAARHELETEHARVSRDLTSEREELRRGLSSTRDQLRRSEAELASAVQAIAERNGDVRQHQSAIGERDQRIAELRKEIEALEQENASYQDQVLRAYQKIKSDEAMVARARKAMAIALTVLDDEGNPPSSQS